MNLVFIGSIVRTSATQLNLYKHPDGQLVLSAILEKPEGTVYFTTSEGLLEMFHKGHISLQQLFDNSPSNHISIFVNNNNTRIFLCGAMNIQLRGGEKCLSDLDK